MAGFDVEIDFILCVLFALPQITSYPNCALRQPTLININTLDSFRVAFVGLSVVCF